MKSTYNLSDEFVAQLNAVVADANSKRQSASNVQQNSNPTAISPKIFYQDSKIYFTQSDVQMYLFAAAGAGVPAMIAALDAVGFLLGGPIGGVITTVLTLVGAATIANLCYLLIQSSYYNKGIYIGVEWNGPFPNYTQGLW